MKMFNITKIFIIFLFHYFFVTCKKNNFIIRCNADKIEPIPIFAKNTVPISPELKNKRKLDEDGFKYFNIYLDLENFNEEVKQYNINNDLKDIFIQGMYKAIDTLKSLLKVKTPSQNYVFYDEDIKRFSINYWDKARIGTEMANLKYGILDIGVDLFIFVRFGNNTEMGENTIASAGARFVDSNTGQPIIGVANIYKDIDYSKKNFLQYFQSIILHEFIHILGFANYFFTSFYHNIITKFDQNGKKRVYIYSSKVTETAKKYFNCKQLSGVELEEYKGDGEVGSHWKERILLGDIMNEIAYPEEQVISEFTLALLEDSGYYKANYYTGGLMQYGKNKGCDF